MSPVGSALRCLLVANLALAVTVQGKGLCGEPYRGFDSRLEPRLIGRLPAGSGPVAGLATAGGALLVVLPDRLVAFRDGHGMEVAISTVVVGFGSDASDRIWVQGPGGVSFASPDGLSAPTGSVAGRLVNQGSELFLRVVEYLGRTSLILRGAGGQEFLLASFDLPARAVSWGPEGLTAVLGDRLLTWAPGETEMKVWRSDPVLAEARTVCRLGDENIVVALPEHVLHVSPETAQILVMGFPAACQFGDEGLFLLDESSGLAWEVAGLERLGRRDRDVAYAQQLASGTASAQSAAWRLPEAARLIGCSAALAQRTAVNSPAPTRAKAQQGKSATDRFGIAFQPSWLAGSGGSVLAVRVAPGSPAEQAGLRTFDQLVSIGGRTADTIELVESALAAIPAGSSFSVVVLRAGQRIQLTVSAP